MDASTNGAGIDYWDEYPKHLGPPDIPNYGTTKVMKDTKVAYTVELDAGAFRSLWELLEADAKFRFPSRSTMTTVAARLRAVEAFRRVWWHNHPSEIPTAPVVASQAPRRGRGGRQPSILPRSSTTTAAATTVPPSGAPRRRVIRRRK